MPDLTLFEASTPERLIAGIGAGLALGLMREIGIVELRDSGGVLVVFSG